MKTLSRMKALAKFNWVHDQYELETMSDEEFNLVLLSAKTERKEVQKKINILQRKKRKAEDEIWRLAGMLEILKTKEKHYEKQNP